MTIERLRRCSRGHSLMVRDPRSGGGTCIARLETLNHDTAVVSLMRRDGRGFAAATTRLKPSEVRG